MITMLFTLIFISTVFFTLIFGAGIIFFLLFKKLLNIEIHSTTTIIMDLGLISSFFISVLALSLDKKNGIIFFSSFLILCFIVCVYILFKLLYDNYHELWSLMKKKLLRIDILVFFILICILIYGTFLYSIPTQDDSKYHSLFFRLIFQQWRITNIQLTTAVAPGFINETLRTFTILAHIVGACQYSIYYYLFPESNSAIFLNVFFKLFFFIFVLRFFLFFKNTMKNNFLAFLSWFSLVLFTPHLWYMLKWYPYSQLVGMLFIILYLEYSILLINKEYSDVKSRIFYLIISQIIFALSIFIHILSFFLLITILTSLFLYQTFVHILRNEWSNISLYIINSIIVISAFYIFILLLRNPEIFIDLFPSYSKFFSDLYYSTPQPFAIGNYGFKYVLFEIIKTFYIGAVLGILGVLVFLYDVIVSLHKNNSNKLDNLNKIIIFYFIPVQIFILVIFQFIQISFPAATMIGKMHRLIPMFLIFFYPSFSGYLLMRFLKFINDKIKIVNINLKKIPRFRKDNIVVNIFVLISILLLFTPFFISIQFYGKPRYNNNELEAIKFLVDRAEEGDVVLNDYMGQWIPSLLRDKHVLITNSFMTGSEDFSIGVQLTIRIFRDIISKSDSDSQFVSSLMTKYNISYILFNTYEFNKYSIRYVLNTSYDLDLNPKFFEPYPFFDLIYNVSEIYIYEVVL